MRVFLTPIVSILAAVTVSAAPAEPAGASSSLRRLFDVTPPSESNPALARVPSCGIEIPVSEFTTYASSEGAPMLAPAPGPLSLADRKRLLQQLIDEHLLLWTAYETKANESKGFVQAIEDTHRMLLSEALEAQEIADKAPKPEDQASVLTDLRRRLFEAAEITVSKEVYEDFKTALKKLAPPAIAPKAEEPPADPLAGVPPETAARVLARWSHVSITLADALGYHLGKPGADRPDVGKPDGLVQLLREMLEPALLVAEARKRGLDSSPSVQEKLILNRSALLRFHVQDQLTADAVKRKDAPGLESRLKQWYGAQVKSRYTITDENGQSRVLRFEDEKERIENDYFEHLHEQVRAEKLQALRANREIIIDEKRLEATAVVIPAATDTETSLPATVMTWEADAKEQVIAEGAKALTFTFEYANVSAEDVVVHEYRPSCDCTTVKSPAAPAVIKAGDKGTLEAVVDLRGKRESYTRTLTVGTNRGDKILTLKIVAPAK